MVVLALISPMAARCADATNQAKALEDMANSMKSLASTLNGIQVGGMQGVTSVPAGASAGDGCSDESNDRILAELALCSTHAYNVGWDKNPDTATDKQLMRDVVALKTTVMTQQMNKQYEYMDAMLRRFKTQLEKAILTTKLQAAGATTTTTSGTGGTSGGGVSVGGTSNARITNVTLDGAQNCASILDYAELINCLSSNYTLIYEATNTGQTVSNEARKQLITDFKILINSGLVDDSAKRPQANGKYTPKCETSSNMTRAQLQDCLEAHAANIRTAKAANAKKEEKK